MVRNRSYDVRNRLGPEILAPLLPDQYRGSCTGTSNVEGLAYDQGEVRHTSLR